MNASEYQKEARRTLPPGLTYSGNLTMAALGLTGEAGEVAEAIKKHVFHRAPLDTEEVEAEIGDVLWYVAATCEALGLDMGRAMERNLEKLRARYPEGFVPGGGVR